MITEIQIVELSEQIQEDLLTVLDGLPDAALTAACEVVTKNINKILQSN